MDCRCGLHLIQVLPVNDTSVNKMWWDSYPYSSLSVFALHPQVRLPRVLLLALLLLLLLLFLLIVISITITPSMIQLNHSVTPPVVTSAVLLTDPQYLCLRALREEMPVEIGMEVISVIC